MGVSRKLLNTLRRMVLLHDIQRTHASADRVVEVARLISRDYERVYSREDELAGRRQKETRLKRKREGICVRCGKAPAQEEYTSCEPCRTKFNGNMRAYRRSR